MYIVHVFCEVKPDQVAVFSAGLCGECQCQCEGAGDCPV